MAGGSRPFAAGFAVGALVALCCAWFLWGRAATVGPAPGQAACATCGADAATPQPSAVLAPAAAVPAAAESVTSSPTEAPAAAISTSAPRDAFDTPAWRNARVAFRPRDLGRLGPYVRAGLDAARRDMDFCFRQAGAPTGGPAEAPAAGSDQGDTPPPRADPAVLLLYVEAREGALDVVGTTTEHRGTASPELVECCREVLRGLEIKAFNTSPGQRYRLKFRLQ
jgi:hypothetical protein